MHDLSIDCSNIEVAELWSMISTELLKLGFEKKTVTTYWFNKEKVDQGTVIIVRYCKFKLTVICDRLVVYDLTCNSRSVLYYE